MRFGRDQGIYAMVASTVVDGGMPYRDAWDFKPPGIYLVYALAQGLFGRNEWGIRVVEMLCLASLWPALRRIAWRLFEDARIGSIAAALAILMEAELEFWHTAQPESFGGVLTIWSLALVTELTTSKPFARRHELGIAALAGTLFGMAALMKPHLGGGVLVAAGYLALRARGKTGQARTALPASATMLGLSLVPTLGVAGWFAARGALSDLVETLFVFAPGYVATTFRSREISSLLYHAVVGTTCGFSALVPVGLLVGMLGSRADGRDLRPGLGLVSAMAVPQVLGLALQAKFFPYHHAALLPLCALLAAPGLLRAWDFATRRRWIARACALGATLLLVDAASSTRDLPESFLARSYHRTRSLLFGCNAERDELDSHLYSVADVSYGANVEVARWLAAETEERDHVYLWGFEPFVYYAARRAPGSRFIYNVPQRGDWSKGWARPALMKDLHKTRPRVIAVLKYDVFPMVTGNALDSQSSLQDFGELQDLLSSQYDLATSVQDFDLYRLRGGARGEHASTSPGSEGPPADVD